MICPDHSNPRDPITGLPVEDSFIKRDGLNVCSFCGSLDPGDFMAAVLEGHPLATTMKDYKVYAVLPNPIAGQEVLKSTSGGPTMSYGKLLRDDFTPEELAAGRYELKTYGPAPATAQVKFYWRHLSERQQLRFVGLLNDGLVNFEGGFGFSHLPFFVGVKGRDPVTHEYPKPITYCIRGHEND